MKKFIILCIICVLGTASFAQVFPGDVSNNGKVDNVDLLYIGYAFGAVGPARLETNTDFEAQQIPLEWEETFPNGVNFAHADANGDGVVDGLDITTVYTNYGQEQEIVFTDSFLEGLAGVDPQLDFNVAPVTGPLTEGSSLTLPLFLGSEDLPIDQFNGIAFTIEYNSQYISSLQLELRSDWLGINESASEVFQFLVPAPGAASANQDMDIALTRYGQNPVSGHGQIGVLNIIIQDDLIGFMQTDSSAIIIKVKDIKLIDEEFNEIPVAGDCFSLVVYHPNALATSIPENPLLQTTQLFPNPAFDWLHIQTQPVIEQLAMYDQLGQLVYRNQPQAKSVRLPVDHLLPGIYVVKISTPEGVIDQKIIISSF